MPATVQGRVPPHDLDAEAVVLSAILLSRDALDMVLEVLMPEHFYSDVNARIFEAARTLAGAGTPVDVATVNSWINDRGRRFDGGLAYLAELADKTPAVAHVRAHALVVYEKWRIRQLIATCQKVAAEGYGDVGMAQAFIDGAEQAIYEIAHDGRTEDTNADVATVLKIVFKEITEAADRGERITGISTGYEKLDAKTAGLKPGDLTIIAARPGMGKTSFVMNLGVNVASPRTVRYPNGKEAVVSGYGVQVFSLEMPKEQLGKRLVCSEARVDLGRMHQGYLQPDDWRRLTESASYVSSLPLWIDDKPDLSLLDLRAKVRRRMAEFNRPATENDPGRKIGLVVVDYLQLMKGSGTAQNREQEISELSRGLKALARELGVAVIALSQLNRAVESRSTKDKRPQLSDLRESGAIEQDADNIIFIYRDEYYHPETTEAKGLAELIVAKQRNGPTGKVITRFTASCTRFDNIAFGDYPEDES